MKTKQKVYSPFAKAVESLLDDTRLFSREAWAYVLHTTVDTLSAWTTDELLPRGEALRQLLDILDKVDGIPKEPLAQFDTIKNLPATDVSPLGKRMMPDIETYMKDATLMSLGRSIRGMTKVQQQIVLTQNSWPKECC